MRFDELARLKTAVAIEYCRQILSTADMSNEGCHKLTDEQNEALDFLTVLYYDGEITYGELWRMMPKNPLPPPGT
jgi:hypothetical protein